MTASGREQAGCFLGRQVLSWRAPRKDGAFQWVQAHPATAPAGSNRSSHGGNEVAESQSAGLLLFRGSAADLEVLLGHPGGPFWQNKDDGAWSIPKGLIGADEAPLSAARREFVEETGHDPDGDFLPLGEARQPGGKVVQAWAIEGDWDPALIRSNTFEMEWPPRSGRRRTPL